ncbi:general substrate transporter [Tricharina praecox]|uniref:general substrate transporter n=1 Tax=Tricharina praecox TaxID=43433 RepID=UPI00221EF770|nr:general substrate transporter [Tricharina praecox]KAI5846826.1 general substrate transporter [Tricharina praecox]
MDQYLRLPPPYVLYAIFASIGGFIFGFDTGSIGPITLMRPFQRSFGVLSPTMQGLLVSSILLSGALASFFAGWLSDRLSRTYSISLGATVFAVGAALCASAHTLAQLFVGRLVCGAGEGVFISCVAVYVLEIAPVRIRGTVACILQLFITLGIMIGYFVCYGCLQVTTSMAWRTPFVMQTVFAVVLALGSPYIAHSPRWLLLRGRRPEAARTLVKLGIGETEREELMQHALNPDEKAGGYRAAWGKDVRGRTALAATQNLSGIDGVLYYAPVLFRQAGLEAEKAAFLASAITGVVNVVFTAVAQIFADKWGRRPTLIVGGLLMAVPMTAIGAIYAHPTASTTHGGQYTVIALIMAYFIAFIMSWAILMRIHVSEAQPVRTRASVSSLAQCANWVVNWVVAFSTPMFLDKSPSGPYFLWAASIWVAVAVMAVYLPETRGREMEQFDGKVNSSLGRWVKGLMERRMKKGTTSPRPTPTTHMDKTKEETDVIRYHQCYV